MSKDKILIKNEELATQRNKTKVKRIPNPYLLFTEEKALALNKQTRLISITGPFRSILYGLNHDF